MNIVVNLNKKRGISSHEAVSAVKRIFKVRKAGHTGTLDPIASGTLLVCLNEATKITGYLEALEKEYVATAKLGESTDTYDSEGRVLDSADTDHIEKNIIEKALQRFVGFIDQVPPMYSAVKIAGQPLYKLARKGIEIERAARRVFVKSIEIINFENPFLTLKIVCSKGVYVRSIINDLGCELGVGAHMTDLIRTRIGIFRIEDSAVMEKLPDCPTSLFSIDKAISHLPELCLSADDARKAKNGVRLSLSLLENKAIEHGAAIRLKDSNGGLFGIGKALKDSIKIERILRL